MRLALVLSLVAVCRTCTAPAASRTVVIAFSADDNDGSERL